MLKFSANLTMLFGEYPLLERIQQAKQHGFSGVEIQFPYDIDPYLLKDHLQQQQMPLVLINVPAGDLMHGGNGLAGVPSREHLFRQAVFEAIHRAKILNVPTLNILAGKQPQDADLLPCLNTLAKNLRFACQEMLNAGIQPVIEAINGKDMPRFLIQNVAQLQEMREAVGIAELKMQYDCYHMASMGEPVLEGLQQNIQHIGHIQFADYPHRHEPRTGTLDFGAIFDFIQHSNYLGWTGAEYRPSQSTALTLDWLSDANQQPPK